jgi:hypothetical protein
MNSLDPWRIILTNPWDEVIVPAPFYGHSLYWEVPSWIHYGSGGGGVGYGNGNGNGGNPSTHRLLFDGAFIGGEAPLDGISVRKALDDKQVLHVEICVNGKCYRTSMNLAPVIALIMKELAQWHEDIHAHPVSPTTVVGAVEVAVNEAGRSLVGALIGCPASAQAKTTTGALLPVVLAAAAGAYGGTWWSNRSWEHQLREGARRGDNIYWNDQLIYVPSTS